ncbi:interferon-inducible double-stranded RNA-dependent protein kinase activator A homolog [Ctenocephalides felis]|uniref:interferon-inducible double-stranded RNA-dependent protein kinase activator A homolog n=1 Tax=Ctenocephalides felis TaxID=7515 RepID=UPI000E6E23CD|nr:interferon-inducible double-stranded RNA-dependent protein kinase activator A homolog [Ctenocephalides felis]
MSNLTPMAALNELMMQKKAPVPLYELIEDGIPLPGYKYFVKAANIIAVGTGRNKKEAKHNGAAIVLKLLALKGVEHRQRGGDLEGRNIRKLESSVGALTAYLRLHDIPQATYDISVSGPAHDPIFTVRCSAFKYHSVAFSAQKKRAKQQASADLLERGYWSGLCHFNEKDLNSSDFSFQLKIQVAICSGSKRKYTLSSIQKSVVLGASRHNNTNNRAA